jgi:GNAT superfamily N-acetyltransferase
MEFRRETWGEFNAEARALFAAHFEEVDTFTDIPLSVDERLYEQAEKLGVLRVFTVRDGRELVGYAMFMVRLDHHRVTLLQAQQDVIYIRPDRRGIGAEFIKWCEKQLADDGVQVIFHGVKSKHNWGRLLERQGYELTDLLYAKRLF